MNKTHFALSSLIRNLIVVIAASLTLLSCGKKSNPKTTAQQFLDGLYHLDFPSAKAVATEQTKAQLDKFSQRRQQDFKKDAMSIRVLIEEPVVKGDQATVDYKLSNDATVRTLKMIKQDGQWLAEWSKMDFGGATMIDMIKGKSETPPQEIEPDVPLDSTVNPLPDSNQVR